MKEDDEAALLVEPDEDAVKECNEEFDDYLELVVQVIPSALARLAVMQTGAVSMGRCAVLLTEAGMMTCAIARW